MVTVLAGVIAVLGTSVAFLSSESLNSLFGDLGETFENTTQESIPSSPQIPQENSESVIEEQQIDVQGSVVDAPATIECRALNTSGEYPVVHTGEKCFQVFNVHTWVNKVEGRINERSTTAFVIENTGTKAITIDSIVARDVAVPVKDWFFTTDPAIVRPANLQKGLPVDYTESAIVIGGGLVMMKSGTLTLEPKQAAIVYLNEAGNITEKDIGRILVLHVQSGNIRVETAVPIFRA